MVLEEPLELRLAQRRAVDEGLELLDLRPRE